MENDKPKKKPKDKHKRFTVKRHQSTPIIEATLIIDRLEEVFSGIGYALAERGETDPDFTTNIWENILDGIMSNYDVNSEKSIEAYNKSLAEIEAKEGEKSENYAFWAFLGAANVCCDHITEVVKAQAEKKINLSWSYSQRNGADCLRPNVPSLRVEKSCSSPFPLRLKR